MRKRCPMCGKEFEPFYAKKKYCSDECIEKAAREYQEKYRREHRKTIDRGTCPVCGKKFIPQSSLQKYCSVDCRDDFHREKARKKYLENADKIRANRRSPRRELAAAPKTKAKRESTLDKFIAEAADCGLQYGEYVARLKMGKTYQELRRAYINRVCDCRSVATAKV